MLIWNSVFYFIIFLATAFVTLDVKIVGPDGAIKFLAMYFCITRVNELVFAFFHDAINNGQNKKRMPINRQERIILLSLAYVEIIIWFGFLYAVLEGMYPDKVIFNNKFESILDACFLSGVTITTLGSGDFYPTNTVARFSTLYEAIIGIIFIAVGLAAYIGAADETDSPESQADTQPPRS
ncbi:ion channel [Methyloraptor flagellatus]|uniref:Potassium channel family protein n=1 Tax=Methyloraptor flagellatus TaxID=3162530 RepID=A0AAU7X8X7_9HYPH